MLSYHPGASINVIKDAIFNGASTLQVNNNEILCDGNRRLNAYGAFQEFHNPVETYVCENSYFHSVICAICNSCYFEEHNWVPNLMIENKALIAPIAWFCSKCGIAQV